MKLTFHDVDVQKLAADDEYDFDSWSGGRRSLQFTVSAVNGQLSALNPNFGRHGTAKEGRRKRVHRFIGGHTVSTTSRSSPLVLGEEDARGAGEGWTWIDEVPLIRPSATFSPGRRKDLFSSVF